MNSIINFISLFIILIIGIATIKDMKNDEIAKYYINQYFFMYMIVIWKLIFELILIFVK